ncbi:peroxisomal N(1)-acetyl-spermine/spermidine oxidase-like [Portunus trituberculatus]|uniref:peroxisomal N(1)-acetyl-spermine/spermidine oxidase-like n=1 Tax=Portunus trituberculatus TaxID=210409 RepID=UPI001E1D10D0|nr:peroxisomal N(1)-acetyl-spermine/spermidine oxidase-like [Portunus trituberculatus]
MLNTRHPFVAAALLSIFILDVVVKVSASPVAEGGGGSYSSTRRRPDTCRMLILLSVSRGPLWMYKRKLGPSLDIGILIKIHLLKCNELDENPPLDDDWNWQWVTEEGQPGNVRDYDKLMMLLEETEEAGVLESYYDTSYGQYFLDRFQEVFPDNTQHREGLLQFLHQTVNTEEGTGSWLDMSAEDADQYDFQGEDYQWKNGYDTLITHLKKTIPDSIVHLSSPVTQVQWDSSEFPSQALVVTQNGKSFYARHVLVTVPSAYLQKNHATMFQPSLPNDFLQNLEAVKLGVANKVQIGWAEPWWGNGLYSLNILWSQFNLPPHMAWLYDVVSTFSVHQQKAVVELFVTGGSSIYMEELKEEEVKDHVMDLITKASGQDVPQPTFFRRTRWSRDPWTLGSYATFITVEGNRAGLHSHSQLASPIKNSAGHTVLLWAGEHTHDTRYGTVDGAMDTGNKEALRILSLKSSSL